MNTEEQKVEIRNKALASLAEQTGLTLLPMAFNEKRIISNIITKEVDAVLREEKRQLLFDAEIKKNIYNSMLGGIQDQLSHFKNVPLLIAAYVNSVVGQKLQELQINYIDTAGNAHINVPPIYIHITGKKLKEKPVKAKSGDIFNTSGLRIIYALLCNPGLEQKPLRDIASIANTSLGSAQKVFKDLQFNGYLIEAANKEKRLFDKENLLKKWILYYSERLQYKYIIGRYKSETDFPWREIDITKTDMLWGGETAAAILTNYLRPFIHTIYAGNNYGEFILRNRLNANQNGNIILTMKFWNFKDKTAPTVHPILVYADLMSSGDSRNIETANILYEREIVKYIK